MEDLLEIYGGEVPEHIVEFYEKVLTIYHKKANGPLTLQIACLVAVLANEYVIAPSTKATKKTEKVTA